MAVHRYWRILVDANNGSGTFTDIAEIEFRETVGGPTVTGTCFASSEFSSSFDCAKAFDTINTTLWATASGLAIPSHIGLDLGMGNEADIVEFSLAGLNGTPPQTQMPKDFRLQYSDDDITYTDKVLITGETGWQIHEIRVYSATAPAFSTAVRRNRTSFF